MNKMTVAELQKLAQLITGFVGSRAFIVFVATEDGDEADVQNIANMSMENAKAIAKGFLREND